MFFRNCSLPIIWLWNHLLTVFGLSATSGYLYCIYHFRPAIFTKIFNPSLKINELGDFLGGVFGPLALFWLIIGYFQQQKELRQNTEALKLQAEELKNLVKVNSEQAETDRESLKLERNRAVRETQPVFEFVEAVVMGTSGTQSEWKFKIKNVGKPAPNVRYSSTPSIPEIDKTLPKFIDTGKPNSVIWKSNTAHQTLNITVKYQGINARELEKVFELKLNKDNPSKHYYELREPTQ